MGEHKNMGKKLDIKKDDLYDLYVIQNKTNKEIAEKYNCHPDTIGRYLKMYKIPKRTVHSWTAEFNNKTKTKYNKYDLTGKYGIGWTTNTNQEFYFDLEDYELIKDYCWMENNEGYIYTRIRGKNKYIRLHNLVTGWNYVDHIKHKLYDNRKSELRKANDYLNSRNRSIPCNNRSGCKGVSWHKRDQKWRAYISHNHKWINLGNYEKLDEAIKARKEAEEKYQKEWSYDNSMAL